MSLYELRTYTLLPGKIGEATKLYTEIGWPALSKHGDHCMGYFTGDVGALNQIIHVWKFEDDADRRRFWAGVYGDDAFMAFAAKFRPLVLSQENKLMFSAPWGPTP